VQQPENGINIRIIHYENLKAVITHLHREEVRKKARRKSELLRHASRHYMQLTHPPE
jgi:hypothetical protein